MIKILLIFASIIPFGALAESPDSTAKSPILLDEVVVSSFKQDKLYRLSAVSATVVNSTTIENKNLAGLKDFSSFIPNLFIPDYGSKLTSPVYIRGIGSKINAPSVGLYVDDMPFFEKSAFDIDFFDIERVEVLRGPQGTLYGRNTMAGTINIYTKSPRKYQGTHINLSQGNYTNTKAILSHYGKINEKIGYSLSGNYDHSNGYFTNLYNNKKVDDLDAASARIKLEWTLTPQLQLDIISTLDYSDQGGYPYSEYDTDTETFADIQYNRESLYRRTISTSGINLRYQGSGYQLYGQTSFQYLSDKQGIDQDFSEKDLYYAIQKQQQRMVSGDWNIKSKNESNYKWLFGTFGFYQDIDNSLFVDKFALQENTTKLNDFPTTGVALYHQSSYNNLLIDGLSLTAGLRYDYEKATSDHNGKEEKSNKETVITEFRSDLHFNQFTPKFSVQYTLPGGQMFYATIANGYKTGGFNTSFDREEDRSFDPEHSWNYEAGSKLSFLRHRLEMELAVFYIDWKNQQITQSLPSQQGSMQKNAGRSESKGVEISMSAHPVKGLIVRANYGYTHAKFKKYQRDATRDYSGKYIPFVPAYTYMLGADYTIERPCADLDKITLSVDYTGTGKLYWNDSNTLYRSAHGVLNGKINFTKKNVTLSIWGRNITNSEYASFVFESFGKSFAQRGKPFTFGGNITVRL